MNLRSLTPRIVLGAVASAGLALLMVVLASSAAREGMQRDFDSRLASSQAIAACEADPASFGSAQGPGPKLFAYDPQGHSANPVAPPLEPSLVPPPGQPVPLRVQDPVQGDALIALRAAGNGPCAVFRVGFDGPPPRAVWEGWPFAALAVFSMLCVAGLSYAFTVRPVLRRVAVLAEQAGAIASNAFPSMNRPLVSSRTWSCRAGR